MSPLDFIIVAACGLGVGVLSGMFGIGGGGLIVPLLNVVFGLPVLNATATSLLTIALTGVSGAVKHLRQHTADLRGGLLIGGFGALASVLSALYADQLSPLAIVLLTMAVILFSVGMMLRELLRGKGTEKATAPQPSIGRASRSMRGKGIEEVATSQSPIGRTSRSLRGKGTEKDAAPTTAGTSASGGFRGFCTAALIGLVGGAMAGLIGVGGGFIIVPFCVSHLGFSLKRAAGTSLVAITIIAIPGIIVHALLSHIWWFYGLAVVVGTIPGAQLGAWLIARLPERPMHLAFCLLLVAMSTMMLLKQLLS